MKNQRNKKQVLDSDSKKLDCEFRDNGIYMDLDAADTAVECAYLITCDADISSLSEAISNLQESRAETLKHCNSGKDGEVKDKEKFEEREKNIDKIRECEELVLDCLIDRSKM